MNNMNKKVLAKKLWWGKLASKLVVFLGVIMFALGFLNMFLYSVVEARPFLTLSAVFVTLGMIGYVASRVVINVIYHKYKDDFTPKERKSGKVKAAVTLGISGVLVASVVIGASAIKPSLGDMGNIIDMVAYAGLSYVNPIKGKAKANKLLEKTDGFMEGICHIKTLDQALIAKEANISWNREDIGGSYTYNMATKEVTPSQGFIDRLASWKEIRDNADMKYFCVTPYPEDYSYMQVINPLSGQDGVILRGLSQEECTDELHVEINEEALGAVAKFFMKEMLGVVYAYQISNELMGSRFRYNNMTMDEAAYFIGVQLQAMCEAREELVAEGYEEAADIIIGYNVCDFTAPEFIKCMRPYNKYCDYVGLDLYIGCFENIMKDIWYNEFMMRYIYQMTGKPTIMCEFGYIGEGTDKTREEKDALVLEKYGPEFKTVEDCKNDTVGLLKNPKFSESLRNRIILVAQQNYNDTSITIDTITQTQAKETLFGDNFRAEELQQHFFCIMNGDYEMTNYRHSREDQARFFADVIPQMANMSFTIGTFVYHFPESDECYFCGQGDCPIECGWGIYREKDDTRFPAFYAIQKAYGDLDQKKK